jgi:hypothetical protein
MSLYHLSVLVTSSSSSGSHRRHHEGNYFRTRSCCNLQHVCFCFSTAETQPFKGYMGLLTDTESLYMICSMLRDIVTKCTHEAIMLAMRSVKEHRGFQLVLHSLIMEGKRHRSTNAKQTVLPINHARILSREVLPCLRGAQIVFR